MADIFVTTREGKPPYTNNDQMRRAIRKTVEDILKIEEDTMDMHKTKQLAYVLYILSSRSLHEDIWQGVED